METSRLMQALFMFAQNMDANRIAYSLNVTIEELSSIVSKYVTFL
jgi:hypothetical protein